MPHKPKVLVVEHEPANLRQLDITLRSMGADPHCLGSSQEAAERINREKFDGAFVDWDTPQLNGEELTRRIRSSASNSKIPIAMLTERHDAHAIARGFEIGVTFFLSKPVGGKELGRLLNASRGAMLEERRRYQRAPIALPVACAWDQRKLSGESVNLSASGILVALPHLPDPGTTVTVKFRLPRLDATLSLEAVAVRTAPGSQAGLKFVGLSREQRDTLKFFVDRQLSAPRR